MSTCSTYCSKYVLLVFILSGILFIGLGARRKYDPFSVQCKEETFKAFDFGEVLMVQAVRAMVTDATLDDEILTEPYIVNLPYFEGQVYCPEAPYMRNVNDCLECLNFISNKTLVELCPQKFGGEYFAIECFLRYLFKRTPNQGCPLPQGD